MHLKLALWSAIAFTLAGCGGSEPAEPADEPAEPPRPSVFDPLTSTIDRAQGVQQTVDRASRRAAPPNRDAEPSASDSRAGNAARETPATAP